MDADTIYRYDFDTNARLATYRDITLSSRTDFLSLDIDTGPWTEINGMWSVNDNGTGGNATDDFFEADPGDITAIEYVPVTFPDNGFTFRYRSPHVPDDADDDGTAEEYRDHDYPARYYAQVTIVLESNKGVWDPDPYLAVRIEPDRIGVVHFDGTTIHELDNANVETEEDTWYSVEMRGIVGGPGFGGLTVTRKRDDGVAGAAAVSVLTAPVTEIPSLERDNLTFTVGKDADYDFQLVDFADGLDLSATYVDWARDAYGRIVARTEYGLFGVISQRFYQWDGWRLLTELDGENNNAVIAEYVPGPNYVDDIVASRRDLNDNGKFSTDEEFHHLTDQQYSTVALMDADGNTVERYTYDAFGDPTYYDGAGAALPDPNSDGIIESAYGNEHLYTGRRWHPEMQLYDYRQRVYDPATGRFLTTDPVYDPVNLGNPYTYVGNNPGKFVDPYGEQSIYDVDALTDPKLNLNPQGVRRSTFQRATIEADYRTRTGASGVARIGGEELIAAPATVLSGGTINAGTRRGIIGALKEAPGLVLRGVRKLLAFGADEGLQASDEALEAAANLQRFRNNVNRGNAFNEARKIDYPFNEVYIEGAGRYPSILDSYNPDLGEIVSRKHTQFTEIEESTARAYIREIPNKYPRGARIADVPTTREMGVAGRRLEGDYYLEVPVQDESIPQSVLEYARQLDVRIRDITGHIYR